MGTEEEEDSGASQIDVAVANGIPSSHLPCPFLISVHQTQEKKSAPFIPLSVLVSAYRKNQASSPPVPSSSSTFSAL